MRIKEIHLKNYRNYNDQEVKFTKNLNIFLGNNAQGKTNILESIYLLAFAKSHRTYRDAELIKYNENEAKIEAFIEKEISTLNLEIEISKKGKLTKVNHLRQNKLSNYIGKLNVVLFAPEDLDLIKGTPNRRRKFIDMELGQIKPIYLKHLVEYQKILKQRNSHLKQGKIDEIMLDVFDESLALHGSYIINARKEFISNLEKIASKLHKDISKNKETLTLKYETFLDENEFTKEKFLEVLKNNRLRDIEQRKTLKGPHRDDLLLYINGNEIQKYGSQGQQRLSALSLKLSEVELIHMETKEYPVLLLDDVMSELDNERQIELMKVIENKVQTFITTTTLDHLAKNLDLNPSIYYVKNGTVTEGKE